MSILQGGKLFPQINKMYIIKVWNHFYTDYLLRIIVLENEKFPLL